MKHHQHTQYPYSAEIKRRLFISKTERRCEAAAGFLLAVAIGVGLACLLVASLAAPDGAPTLPHEEFGCCCTAAAAVACGLHAAPAVRAEPQHVRREATSCV